MEFQKPIHQIFSLLSDSLDQLTQDQYSYRCTNLSDKTIGQHVRHIIEMFQCLEIGYESGEVDYDSRKRNVLIETDKTYASELLKNIEQHISSKNKSLFLVTNYNDLQEEPEKIGTNYFREIAYNLEHTTHHMALIRIGLQEIGNISIDESYGVATSTIKYRQQCVQ
jgi:hypothetical protein